MMLQTSSARITACGGVAAAQCSTARVPATAVTAMRGAARAQPATNASASMRAQWAPEANTARCRVVDHAGDRRVTDRDVERHRHAARAQDAEQQQRELEAVVHEHRDALAGRKPRGGESVSDLRGRALELHPRQPALPAMSAGRGAPSPFAVDPSAIRSGSQAAAASRTSSPLRRSCVSSRYWTVSPRGARRSVETDLAHAADEAVSGGEASGGGPNS